jgi:hypothetical protein
MIIFLFFYFNRKDSISEAADEVIDEINASDEEIKEETHEPFKRKSKSKKKNQDDIIKLMRNSISIGNKSKPTNNINFENLVQAKGVIVSISNELEFHQKQTLKYAIQAGECLYKIQELCLINRKKFNEFLIEFNIKWSKSYVQFLISLYNFSKDYPKISKFSLSLYFIKNNFRKMKLAIPSSKAERDYWKVL